MRSRRRCFLNLFHLVCQSWALGLLSRAWGKAILSITEPSAKTVMTPVGISWTHSTNTCGLCSGQMLLSIAIWGHAQWASHQNSFPSTNRRDVMLIQLRPSHSRAVHTQQIERQDPNSACTQKEPRHVPYKPWSSSLLWAWLWGCKKDALESSGGIQCSKSCFIFLVTKKWPAVLCQCPGAAWLLFYIWGNNPPLPRWHWYI